MAKDLSYAAMDKEKADALAAQEAQIEKQQREQVAAQQAEAEKNPALQAATGSLVNRLSSEQQGLSPNPALGVYSTLAGEVANGSRNQEEYSDNMLKAAQAGTVDPRMVLEDESVLPQFRQALYDSMQQSQGLGSIQ